MKRAIVGLLASILISAPGWSIELFHRHRKTHYLTDNPDKEFVTAARLSGCYICHVKKHSKYKVQNKYGSALAEYLDADDFPQDWVEANPEEAKRRIIAAFDKVKVQIVSADD